jgi:hypothetical protein
MTGWLRKLFPAGRNAPAQEKQAAPTGPFVVNLHEDRLVVHRPDGKREEVSWQGLQRVIVRVAARGPWAGAPWLILVGASGQGCVVPLDAAKAVNPEALLAHVQTLAGFDAGELADALQDAADGKTRPDAVLWQRRAAKSSDKAADADRDPSQS